MMFGTPLGWAIGLTCAFFLFTGLLSLSRPRSFGATLGLELIGDAGLNEVRSQYGGFFLAAGVANALVLTGHIPEIGGILLNIVIFGGLFFGRIVSLLLGDDFGSYVPTIKVLYVIDGAGLAAHTILAASF